MPTVEVIVPWRGGCKHRERNWGWLLKRWVLAYPWSVTIGRCDEGPWVKARAVMPAAADVEADVLIVADADVWCDGVGEALAAVIAGAPWAIPHLNVHRLTPKATAAALAGDGWPATQLGLSERPYRGHPGGGIVVLPRSTLLEVPLDARFAGWGQEDDSWAEALATLAGRPWRGTPPLWHLWHPPQERMSRRHGSRQGVELHRRYVRARGDRPAMAALVEEARSSWATSASS